ncbi:hypothetical protein SAMN05421831_102206 [Allopseudospirillum japonicum]|uniref:Uncharacterized protein n=1 Tax=Allopseudospirillum japonicum TaxID=64971 RepID=A0A1H6R663_9GAMM|nr:hypothetical protein [Allopseudospirillum japonicum]SEI47105.1 hypothetical protein SAMN05421831_102206 [Allopseudospirillum japonicum]
MPNKLPSSWRQLWSTSCETCLLLRYYLLGSSLFFIGGAALLLLPKRWPDTLQAEVIALAAISVMTLGGFLALRVYLRLSLGRIWRWFKS